MRWLLGVLLAIDGLLTELWVAGHVSTIAAYSPAPLLLMAASAIVGAAQFAGARMVIARRPAGPVLAQYALAGSALLMVLELGLGLAPSNLFPSLKWPVVCVYLVYATLAIWGLRRIAARADW
ncbi:MAG: hypothetical protein ABI652_02710 [Acidobacteriota bacterium]